MALKFNRNTDYKRVSRYKKKMRIRTTVRGTAERPRLSVYKSLKHIYAQVVDDSTGMTLVAASSAEKKYDGKSANKDMAKTIGSELAPRAGTKKISRVVFDRNGFRYHGKIKELADAAREAGLKF